MCIEDMLALGKGGQKQIPRTRKEVEVAFGKFVEEKRGNLR
jgi:hypothetical protein